jgi:hypothetical protein
MAFRDYSITPASNTTLADGTYIGANMLRNKVRPALQQIAADGKAMANDVEDLSDTVDQLSGTLVLTSVSGDAVSSRVLLAAIPAPTNGQVAYLSEAGREGWFKFSTANLAASVTADPAKGIYVAPSSDTTGASGAWVRVWDGVTALAEWFGAARDGTTDDYTPIQRALNAASIVQLQRGTYANGTGRIDIPSGKKLKGAGMDATTLLCLPAMTSIGTDMSMLGCTISSLGAEFCDLTIDINFVGAGTITHVNGMRMKGKRFKASRFRVLDCSGYAVYANGDSGAATASGVFEDFEAHNANILLETQYADGVTFNRFYATNDGTVDCDSVLHPYTNSNNVTFSNGYFSATAGSGILCLADSANQHGIHFDHIRGFVLANTTAAFIDAAATRTMSVEMHDVEVESWSFAEGGGGDSKGAYIDGDSTVYMTNCRFKGAQMGVYVDGGAKIYASNCTASSDWHFVGGGVAYGIYSANGRVQWVGGSLYAASDSAYGAAGANVNVIGARIEALGVAAGAAIDSGATNTACSVTVTP